MPIRFTKRTPFGQRSQRDQKRSFLRIRNRIQRSAPVLGGKFATHFLIHSQTEWTDAHFLGTQSPVSYSLALQTTRYEYKELVRDRAWDLSYELAPEREHVLRSPISKDPKTGLSLYRLEPLHYPELDNLTRLDWAQSQHKGIADSGEVQVFERWTLHREYHNSIGLHATIDVPFLTIDTVNAFIDRFLMTEANFLDPAPHTYQYEQIENWGLNANALVEPEDWEVAMVQPQSLEL